MGNASALRPAANFWCPAKISQKPLQENMLGRGARARLEKRPTAGAPKQDQINIVFTLKTLN
jgi:hypothetical protein